MDITQLTLRQGLPEVFKAIQVLWYPNNRPIGHVRYLRRIEGEYKPNTQDVLDLAILEALNDLFLEAKLVRNKLILFNEQYNDLVIQTRGAADHPIQLNLYDAKNTEGSRVFKPIEVKSLQLTLAHWLSQTDERRSYLPDNTLVGVDADLSRVLQTVTPVAPPEHREGVLGLNPMA